MAEEKDDGEKTEEPSQHRLEEFQKKGDIALSRELSNVIMLAGTLSTMLICSVFVYEEFGEFLVWLHTVDFNRIYEQKNLVELFQKTAWVALKCVAPVFGASICLGVMSSFVQVGFLYSPEILTADLDRVNPIKGFGRLFSSKSIVEVIKGLLKFAVVLLITYNVMKNNMGQFMGFLHTEAAESMMFGKVLAIKIGFALLLGLAVVAILDFAWVKFSYRQRLMMTKQEAKQERKEQDGNPEIRNRIRQIQRQMATKRMMNDVKTADVIITNPTHISIAIKYDGQIMVAPSVVAKGSDHMALRIRELAKEFDIPIVENVTLARTLYKTVKVGHGVPRSLYRAVAEILAFVYKLKKKKKALQ